MVREAVAIEQAFWVDALDVALIGLSAESMALYIEFVADFTLAMLGLPKTYGTPNPFPFMQSFSMENKTNFFESRVSEYAKAHVNRSGTGSAPQNHVFTMSADF